MTKVGCYGMDAYDIIQYLSRILLHLEKKVLLVDLSESKALRYSVSGLHEPGKELFDYRGVHFTEQWNRKGMKDYDYVLAVFGEKSYEFMKECDYLYGVTDYQIQNLQKIQSIKQNVPETEQGFLIIRDFSQREQVAYVKHICPFAYIYYLPEDAISMRNRLQCQYDQVFCFRRMSPELREMLWDALLSFEFTKKEIKSAIKKAERGK